MTTVITTRRSAGQLVNTESQIYDLPIQNEEENVDSELSNIIGCEGKWRRKILIPVKRILQIKKVMLKRY